ncbi:MAG: serine/threonine protein kinase, partial [Rhodobacteraceae bacterium]|nr:serine/threonine protein kinase [Paracoccaceae bacterium]
MAKSEGILKSGELLNNTYVIEELVGQGGTGEVYLAKNIVSGRKFAIKILKQEFANNETFINLMKRESDVLHEVRDDAVVRYNELLRSELHGGFVFLVMEYIAGPQLAEIIEERGSIDAASLLLVARRMGQGLKAAHDKKAFHRDMSPDNIILPGGDMAKAKLIDFGIARDLNENAQTVVGGGFAGKYQYAAPEQLDGNVDARSDLYSLGMTLLRAYRGEPIKVGSTLMEIVKFKATRPDTRDVPGKLGILITRLVEPDPADRFQSADEMLAFLDGKSTPKQVPFDEATVVAPQTKARIAGQATAMPPEPGSGGGGAGKWIFILLLLAGLGGGGWYFGIGPGKEMVFGPSYLEADPYLLEIASAGGNAPIRVAGNIPGPDDGAAIDAALEALFSPATVQSSYDFASGVPSESWVSEISQIAEIADGLTQWKIVIQDQTIFLSGEADDENDAAEAAEDATRRATALGYSLSHNITAAFEPIDLAALNAELATYQTCGELRIT